MLHVGGCRAQKIRGKKKENGQEGAQKINKTAEEIKIVIAVFRISFWKEDWQEGALCRCSGLQPQGEFLTLQSPRDEDDPLVQTCEPFPVLLLPYYFRCTSASSSWNCVFVHMNDLFYLDTEETAQSIYCTIFCSSVSCIPPNSRTLFSPMESLTISPTACSSSAPLALPHYCCSSQLFWPALPNIQTTEVSMCEQCNAFKAKPTVIKGVRALKGKIMVYGRGRKNTPRFIIFVSEKREQSAEKKKRKT